MAAEAAVGIGIAAAAIDFYKFSISLAKTVRQIHNALDGLPEDLEECVRSLNAFERLVTRLDRSLQSTDASGPVTEAESDLKYFIDLCRKAGEELDALLQGVLPNPSRGQRRWRDDVRTGLRLLRKRGAFERVIQKVQGYKSELGLLLMERSLTHRAANTASALVHALDNEERNTETRRLLLERLGANEAALSGLVEMFSEARNDFARRQFRNDRALDNLQTILQMANEQQLNPRHIYISFPQFNVSPAAWWYQFCHQTGSRIATATQTLRGVSKLRLQQLVQFKDQSDVRIRMAERASQPKQLLLVAIKGHSRVEQLTLGGFESDAEFAQLLKAYSRSHTTWADWLTLQRPARLHFVKYSKKCVEPNSEYPRLPAEANDMLLENASSSICGSEHPEIIFQLGNSRLVDNLFASHSRLPGFHGSSLDVKWNHSALRASQARLIEENAAIPSPDHKSPNVGVGVVCQAQDIMDDLPSFTFERQMLELMSGDTYFPINEHSIEVEINHSSSDSTSLVPEFQDLLHGLEEYDFGNVAAENQPHRYRLELMHPQMFCELYDTARVPNIVPYLETLNKKTSILHTHKDLDITEEWGIEVETGFDWGLFWWIVLLAAAVLLQCLIQSWKQYIPWLVTIFGPLKVLCKAQRSSDANNRALPEVFQGSLHSPALGMTIEVYSAIQDSPWYGSTIFWCMTTTAVLWNLFYSYFIWRGLKIQFKISIRPPALQLRVYKDYGSASPSGNPDAVYLGWLWRQEPYAKPFAVDPLLQWCFWAISPIFWLVANLSEGRFLNYLSRRHYTWIWRTPQGLVSTLRPAAMFMRLQTWLNLCIGSILVVSDAISAASVISFLRFMYRALPYYLGVIVFVQSGFIFTKLIEDMVGQLTPLCVLQVLGLGFIPHLRIVLRTVILNASFFSLLHATDGRHLHLWRFMLTVVMVGASVASFRW